MAGSLLYALLRAVLEAVAVARTDRRTLESEVLALRRQVQVLERQIKRVSWKPADRMILAALRERLPRSAWAGLLVRPETVLGWHRALVRRPRSAADLKRGPRADPAAGAGEPGFVALDAGSQFVVPALIVVAVAAAAVHFALPPLPLVVRRALVTPFVAVAAGIYWNVIAQVTGGHGFKLTASQAIADPHTAELILGFLIVFPPVYYAMLIYASRQVATREGVWSNGRSGTPFSLRAWSLASAGWVS